MWSDQYFIKMSATIIMLLILCITVGVVKLNNSQKAEVLSQNITNTTTLFAENVNRHVTRISEISNVETTTDLFKRIVTISSNGIVGKRTTENNILTENAAGFSSENATQYAEQKLEETSTENTVLDKFYQNATTSSTETTTFSYEDGKYIPNENVKETTDNVTAFPVENQTESSTYKVPTTTSFISESKEMTLECETPNYERGYCMEIKMCAILVKQLNNSETWPFIRASFCGSSKDVNNPKVCCGKSYNFRNVSKNSGERDVSEMSCGYQKEVFSPRIIGGEEASLGEYPWMALLIQLNKYRENILGCAAFLINTQYVVTAAHCTHPKYIEQKGRIVSVLLGEHNIHTSTDCQGFECIKSTQNLGIMKIITHPDFSPDDKSRYNDIALIKLKKKARFTAYVRPICLITGNYKSSTKYYVSGWGTTEEGKRSDVKMKVELPPFDRAECARKYSKYNVFIQESQICVGGEHQDSCSGDSGGPLMVSSDNGKWYASGIVSFGIGCGQMGWPGVYTNLTTFLPWIKSQMTRMRRPCQTPNHTPGYCVRIKKCAILLKQVNNRQAWPFLHASKCGRANGMPNNPKVCCGNDDDFSNNGIQKSCLTPNNCPGSCVEIKKCPILLKQVNNRQAWPFLRASTCGRADGMPNNPKVCCGSDGDFRNSTEVEDVLPKSCGRQKMILGSRIVGGREAALHEYPWMAILLHRNFYGTMAFGCAAFLIHPRYVITAAHCTHPNSIRHRGSVVFVLLGEHNTATSMDCSSHGYGCGKNTQILEVAKVTTHPDYDPDDIAHYNDIAVIQLKQDALLSDYVQPICLTKESSETPSSYHISGWGKTESGKKSKVKMQVQIPAFDKKTCAQLFFGAKIILRDNQICAGGEELSDTCSGDSGGPLMTSTDGIWYASGVVSFGIGCGVKGWPGVYTDIAKFLPWIKSVLAKGPR